MGTGCTLGCWPEICSPCLAVTDMWALQTEHAGEAAAAACWMVQDAMQAPCVMIWL